MKSIFDEATDPNEVVEEVFTSDRDLGDEQEEAPVIEISQQ